MKSIIFLLAAGLFTQFSLAQNEFINYKAIVKDDSGNMVTNQNVSFRLSILEGVAINYVETHAVLTDDNGIVILNIGQGTPVIGTFNTIDWKADVHSLKTEIDITGGTTYVDLGTTEFQSVPYALNASNVSGLEKITEGGNTGWRLIDANASNHGDIGSDAIDLSIQLDPSTSHGATGIYSVAIGTNSEASGFDSVAIGSGTVASGSGAVALGVATKAESFSSIAVGLFNVGGGNPLEFPPAGTSPVFEIGNGTNNANRSNAMTVLQNGNVGIGTTQPGAALDIDYNSTVISGQINLKESEADFARINMTNAQRPSSFWAIAGFLGTSTSLDQLNFFNSDVGDIMSIKGTGDIQVAGEIQRTATGNTDLLPIAYGSVNPDGTIAGGTGNFSVTYTPASKTYEVNVTSTALTFANSSITINPIFGSPVIQGFNFGGANPGDDFTLTFTSYASGNTVSPAFQFVVYQN